MSLLKIPLILSSIVGMHWAGTAPNSASPSERLHVPRWREIMLTNARIAVLLKGLFYCANLAEGAFVLASHSPPSYASQFITSALGVRASFSAPSSLFVFGSLLTFSGGLLRLLCYRALGRFFTFELSVRSGHRLITSGPYALVRHPAYTGTIVTFLGSLCMLAAPDSVVRASGVMDGLTVGGAIVAAWVLGAFALMGSLFLRIPTEEAMLAKEFGEEWNQWKKNTPHRLVPFLW